MDQRTRTEGRGRLSRRGFLGAAAFAGVITLGGCIPGRSGPDADAGKLIAWPGDDRWPAELLALTPEIQEAYRYAVANPDVLQYMPCFCGCGATSGHTSNKDCYIEEIRPNGSVVLDRMSFG